VRFTPQQDQALCAAGRWLRDGGNQQVFRLFGYAGTGKTTLAKHLAEQVDGRVIFAAFTGKAGYAITVHKAQGSQWPDVVVLDESPIFGRNAARWLYSAITRASDAVTVVLV
jgi:ATP-dependent exoDNAse (exonuclease V) alpha subunit